MQNDVGRLRAGAGRRELLSRPSSFEIRTRNFLGKMHYQGDAQPKRKVNVESRFLNILVYITLAYSSWQVLQILNSPKVKKDAKKLSQWDSVEAVAASY